MYFLYVAPDLMQLMSLNLERYALLSQIVSNMCLSYFRLCQGNGLVRQKVHNRAIRLYLGVQKYVPFLAVTGDI